MIAGKSLRARWYCVTVLAGATEIATPGQYFITPGQSMQFFDVPER